MDIAQVITIRRLNSFADNTDKMYGTAINTNQDHKPHI